MFILVTDPFLVLFAHPLLVTLAAVSALFKVEDAGRVLGAVVDDVAANDVFFAEFSISRETILAPAVKLATVGIQLAIGVFVTVFSDIATSI